MISFLVIIFFIMNNCIQHQHISWIELFECVLYKIVVLLLYGLISLIKTESDFP